MGCSQRPPVTRHGMMHGFAVALAVLLAGCSGQANVQAYSSNASAGAAVNFPGRSTMSALFSAVFLGGVSYESERGAPRSAQAPGLDPSRRVVEQDCTRPIEDWSGNLRCR